MSTSVGQWIQQWALFMLLCLAQGWLNYLIDQRTWRLKERNGWSVKPKFSLNNKSCFTNVNALYIIKLYIIKTMFSSYKQLPLLSHIWYRNLFIFTQCKFYIYIKKMRAIIILLYYHNRPSKNFEQKQYVHPYL